MLESPCEEFAWDLPKSGVKYLKCINSHGTVLEEDKCYLVVRNWESSAKNKLVTILQRTRFNFLKSRFVEHSFESVEELIKAFKPKGSTGYIKTSSKPSSVFGTPFKFRYVKVEGDKFYWKKFNTLRDLYTSSNKWVKIPVEFLNELKVMSW